MAHSEHDHDITRRYLLGQLTDDEEQKLEERLLSEDDLLKEVELARDELAQDYASGELTAKERKWLQENFLASPEGKQRHEFARTFDQYVRNHPAQRQKKPGLIERLQTLWNSQLQLRVATSTAAVLVVAVIIYSIIPPTPQAFASLTVPYSAGTTRSVDAGSVQNVNLREKDALKLTLMLPPQAASPGSTFRVEVGLSDNNVTETFTPSAQDAQSITVEIPAGQLPRGPYSATIFTVDANGNEQRIGSYPFKVE